MNISKTTSIIVGCDDYNELEKLCQLTSSDIISNDGMYDTVPLNITKSSLDDLVQSYLDTNDTKILSNDIQILCETLEKELEENGNDISVSFSYWE